jgi:sulfate adenylyltransferase subunit 2
MDVWDYIEAEHIDVVPLYFAAHRPVVRRSDTWIMVDDDRLPLEEGEKIETRSVRFRTLGCYPLSGAIESEATNVSEIIAEMQASRFSERQGRLIDGEGTSSMEAKKREGYF